MLFAALLVYFAFTMLRAAVRRSRGRGGASRGAARADRRAGELEQLSAEGYLVRNMGLGIVGSTFAGVVSALLGIGGGIVKVPLMNLGMGVPLRVATATSNLMIGITATASAIIYLIHGGIDPYVAGPTAIGVFLGATLGSRVAHRDRHALPALAVRDRPPLHRLRRCSMKASRDQRRGLAARRLRAPSSAGCWSR